MIMMDYVHRKLHHFKWSFAKKRKYKTQIDFGCFFFMRDVSKKRNKFPDIVGVKWGGGGGGTTYSCVGSTTSLGAISGYAWCCHLIAYQRVEKKKNHAAGPHQISSSDTSAAC